MRSHKCSAYPRYLQLFRSIDTSTYKRIRPKEKNIQERFRIEIYSRTARSVQLPRYGTAQYSVQLG